MQHQTNWINVTPELETGLAHFHGSETLYKHWLGGFVYTEGVKYLADTASCYWLIDAIASYQPICRKDMMLTDFQLWYLLREGQNAVPWMQVEGNGALLTCWRDIPYKYTSPAIHQAIEISDFPLPYCKLYYSMGVLMLPSEH